MDQPNLICVKKIQLWISGLLGWLGIHRSEKHLSYTVGIAIVWHSGIVDNQNCTVWKKIQLWICGPLGWLGIHRSEKHLSYTVGIAIVWHSGLVDNQNRTVWKKNHLWICGPLGWLGIHRSEIQLTKQYCSHCYCVAWVSGTAFSALCEKKCNLRCLASGLG